MSKKIIICADGTWNTEDQVDHGTSDPTNVVKIARALLPLDDHGVDQIIYYHSGVGTNFNQHIGGGAFGAGLFANIQDCYRFLIHNYVPGDRLYFFGFSRGAYTARSLAGLVRNSGILRRGHEDQQEAAFLNYQNRSGQTAPDSPQMQQFRQEHSYTLPGDTGQAIEMIGVWDTVGALGVPANVLGLHLPGTENCQFHDVTLSSYVKSAFHALAIHEHRKEFLPTLWEQSANGKAKAQRLEQVWFTGAHSDVGGGYAQAGLSNLSLLWMIDRASQCGLKFDPEAVGRIQGDPLADAHDSFSALYKVLDFVGLHGGGVWRKIGPMGPKPCFEAMGPGFEAIHESVVHRYHQDPKVAPKFWPESFESIIREMPVTNALASPSTVGVLQPSAPAGGKQATSPN